MELKNLVQIKSGKRMPKGTFLTNVKNSHPYIKVKDMGTYKTKLNSNFEYVPDDIFPKIDKYIVETNDIILSIVGTIGNVSIIDKSLNKASLTENCVKLIPNEKILNEYLYYFLISPKGKSEIEKGIIGSTQPKLPFYNIELIDIPLVDIDFQQHIVNTIGTIDDLIEKYDNLVNKLEKKILLQYELDTIENYRIYPLKEIVKVIDNRGKTPPLIINSNEHPIIEVAQLTGENMIVDSNSFEKYISNETYSSFFRNGHLLKNDVIISTVGTIGVAAYNFEEGLSIAQNVVALRSNYSYYIYCYLINNKKEILNLDIGGVQPSIKISHLLNQKIRIPSDNNTKNYENIFNEINKINNKKQILIKIKKVYLKKYFR